MKQSQKASDKIIQRMERGAAIEVNKATGGEKSISKRETDTSHKKSEIGTLAGRIASTAGSISKQTQKSAIAREYKKNQLRPDSTKLKFSKQERADPKMAGKIQKSDKAAAQYAKAKKKLPAKKKLVFEKIDTNKAGELAEKGIGKSNVKLTFAERDTISSGRLKHIAAASIGTLASQAKSQLKNSDNAGAQALETGISSAESSVKTITSGIRRQKLKMYRAASRAEKKAIKANVKALYERRLRVNPELRQAGPLAKAKQKRLVKKQYAQSYRAKVAKQKAKQVAQAKKNTEGLKEALKNIFQFIKRNKVTIACIIAIITLLILLLSSISSCMMIFSGGVNTILGTSYTAEDEDILGTDADYEAKEAALAAQVANIPTSYPGYDEYRYYLDEIGHDPFELASYLTAKYNMYERQQVQAELNSLFSQQYTLTITPRIEIRTRKETRTRTVKVTDEETGEETEVEERYEVEVEYEYRILEVNLTNKSLGMVVTPLLTQEELEMYRVYMETQGNKPELFEDHPHASRREYMTYDIPPDALSDERFAAMIKEAEKYLGYPYVWGGSNPSTSFDCSGFVSWVINSSGWNVGRQGAKSLSQICTPVSPAEAKPGDLIFFWKTYNAPDPNAPTHVGIYVGNNMMIHCGNPISYASITTNYWTTKFYGFGRLP